MNVEKNVGIKSRRGMEDFFRVILKVQESTPASQEILSRQQIDILLEENAKKYARLSAYNLPVFKNYGTFSDFKEAESAVPQTDKESLRFLVRCSPKKQFGDFGLERTMDISWDELREFVSNLRGGAHQYTIEIRRYWNADFAGTIIANGSGFVLVEIGAGNHAELDSKNSNGLVQGVFDDEKITPWFAWSKNSTPKHRLVAVSALQFLVSRIDREYLASLKIYAEFVYSDKFGFCFLDISNNGFWLKRIN